MRGTKINGFTGNFQSSFLSCEKDAETIIKKLFVDSKPYSEELKRLLLINTSDCLLDRSNAIYINEIKKTSVADLRREGYIKLTPKFEMKEHEKVKSYIYISFGDFSPSFSNEYFRDAIIEIDVICHTDYWCLDGYAIRPLKIAGYIDGILNHSKLSGLGSLEFVSCSEFALSPTLCGYCLMYNAVHGNDDKIEG